MDLTDKAHSIYNQIKRGDIEGVKIGAGTHKRLADVPFTLLVLVLFALIFMGYMSKVVFFSIVVVIAIGQITWVMTARYLDKKM